MPTKPIPTRFNPKNDHFSMLFKPLKTLFVICLITTFILQTSCSSYQKILKSNDFELKKQKTKEYYNAGEYYKSLPLFEELLSVVKGTTDAEKFYYHYAYAHYCNGDYRLASFYFKNFTEYYPNSALTENAAYMVAYCHYKTASPENLDQTDTRKAIEAFQIFANNYPQSTRLAECNEYIDKLRLVLENKAYNSATLYYKLKNYKAANTSFKNLLNDFPDTQRREEIRFLMIKSNYLYAQNSIETKKAERYKATLNAYYDFLEKYPNSKYLLSAENIFEEANTYLQKQNKSQ